MLETSLSNKSNNAINRLIVRLDIDNRGSQRDDLITPNLQFLITKYRCSILFTTIFRTYSTVGSISPLRYF